MIELRNIRKSYGSKEAVAGISFSVRPGEFLGLLGTSGAGKTTLLNIIAGLDVPTAGEVIIDGRTANDPRILIPPHRRDVGMLFQNLALWPHMTVRGHLEFVLKSRRIPRERREARIAEILKLLHLESHADDRPSTLSGGEAQRAALARALAGGCRVLLLDEPLSNLDTPLRGELLALIDEIHRAEKTTTLFVTHNPDEVFRHADRVAVLDAGRILQIDAPEAVYRKPADKRVALLTGPCDILPGREREHDAVETPIGLLPCEAAEGAPAEVEVAIRPDDIEIADDGNIRGVVKKCFFTGGSWLIGVVCGDGADSIHLRSPSPIPPGVAIRLRPRRALWTMPR